MTLPRCLYISLLFLNLKQHEAEREGSTSGRCLAARGGARWRCYCRWHDTWREGSAGLSLPFTFAAQMSSHAACLSLFTAFTLKREKFLVMAQVYSIERLYLYPEEDEDNFFQGHLSYLHHCYRLCIFCFRNCCHITPSQSSPPPLSGLCPCAPTFLSPTSPYEAGWWHSAQLSAIAFVTSVGRRAERRARIYESPLRTRKVDILCEYMLTSLPVCEKSSICVDLVMFWFQGCTRMYRSRTQDAWRPWDSRILVASVGGDVPLWNPEILTV